MNKSFLYVGLMVVVFILLSVVLLVNGITINKLSFWTILLIADDPVCLYVVWAHESGEP